MSINEITGSGGASLAGWRLHPKGHAMRNMLAKFIKNDSGATAIEYGLIAAGISVAIITVVASLGSALNTTFTSVSTALK
jgi:pilus assembly protein Flp/PilA